MTTTNYESHITALLAEIEQQLNHLQTRKSELQKKISFMQEELSELDKQIKEQQTMRIPLERLSSINPTLNKWVVDATKKVSSKELYDRIYVLISERGTMRTSDIAEELWWWDRKEEVRVYTIIKRLEFDRMIQRIPEILPTGKPREKNFLYGIISSP